MTPAPNIAAAFPGLVFEPKAHRYTHPAASKPLVSVTTFIKRFSESFDAPANAARMAAKPGATQTAAELLAEWAAKADTSRAHGTAVHEFIEAFWYAKAARYEAHAGPTTGPAPVAFLNLYTARLHQLAPVALEQRIYNLEAGLAGTVDALLQDPQGALWVFDWKTNARFRTTAADTYGRHLLPPFGDLPHNELAEYSIQLSLYRLMLERAGIPTAGAVLVHVPREGDATLHPAYDLRARLAGYFGDSLPAEREEVGA